MKKLGIHSNRTLLAGLLGAGLGVCVFFLVCTFASLRVTDDAWLLAGRQGPDLYQHYAGWLFFRNSPVSFPWGCAQAMNGAAVSFSDSVPIAALFFRMFGDILPETFQYFGLYNLLCMALQGTAAAMLVSLFFTDFPRILLGAGLFLIQPVLIDRLFRHTSLASQFLIVFALYLYFKNRRQGFRFRTGWLVLSALSVAIHPYFVPMLMALLLADTLAHAVKTRKFLQSAAFVAANLGVVLLSGYCIGAFSSSGAVDSTYGFWSMNLNALWNSASAYVSDSCSRLLPALPLCNGNADGFNYAGLGVLFFGTVGLAAWLWRSTRSKRLALLQRHWALILVCACLSAFAVTHVISFNGRVLFTLPLPQALVRLCSTFRASGRMFWPIGYLLLLCTFVFWGRRKQSFGVTCALMLFSLQLWDVTPALVTKRQLCIGAPAYAYKTPMLSGAWDALAGHYKSFFSLDGPLQQPYYPALWAAKNSMTTNDPFTARYDAAAHAVDVQAATEQLLAGEYDADTLYFTCDFGRFQQLAEALLGAGADVTCAQIDNLWYAVIPNKPGVSLPAESDLFRIYPHFPLLVADYTDALWDGGVLTTDPRTVLLYDSAVTAAVLDDATHLVCEGVSYEILNADYKDAGWVMVTLDTPDAGVLRGKELTRG